MGNTASSGWVGGWTSTGSVYYPHSMNAEHLNHLYREVSRLRDRLDTLEQGMAVTQADLDGLTAAIESYHQNILTELDNLENQITDLTGNVGGEPPANPLDLSGLRNAIDALPNVPVDAGPEPTPAPDPADTSNIPPAQDTLSTDPTVGDTETTPNDPDIPVVIPPPLDDGPTGA